MFKFKGLWLPSDYETEIQLLRFTLEIYIKILDFSRNSLILNKRFRTRTTWTLHLKLPSVVLNSGATSLFWAPQKRLKEAIITDLSRFSFILQANYGQIFKYFIEVEVDLIKREIIMFFVKGLNRSIKKVLENKPGLCLLECLTGTFNLFCCFITNRPQSLSHFKNFYAFDFIADLSGNISIVLRHMAVFQADARAGGRSR